MSNLVRRGILRSLVFGGTTALVAAGPNIAFAQITCYVTRCAVYPDGTQVCERTPVACSSIKHWL
jgi:hypothetical protein